MSLTKDGLTTRRQPEILEQLVTDERIYVHPNISTRDDGILGHINQIISLKAAEVEAIVQAGFDNKDVDLAEGKWLDDLAREKGLIRQPDAYSNSPFVRLKGADGTTVPVDTLLRSAVTGGEYSLQLDTLITTSNCLAVTYSVNNVENTLVYTTTVNSVNYAYTSSATATALEILTGIANLINTDVNAEWTALVDNTEETLRISTDNTTKELDVSSTTYFTVESCETYGYFIATDFGPDVSPAGTLNIIITPVGGLDSAFNDTDVVVGRFRELDNTLRNRIKETRVFRSVATIPAIKGRLRNVPGVTTVSVINNPTNNIDQEGRPPHHYECVVLGGIDSDIAETIWLTKPAGIGTYGSTTTIILDEDGNQRAINYSRPTAVNIAFRVTYTVYAEEIVPINIVSLIKRAITDSIGGLDIDVIPHRYYGPIFQATAGLESLTVEVQVIPFSGDPPISGAWQTTPISIASALYATTQEIDITVIEV